MLLIPKKHIATISDMADKDSEVIGWLFLLARDLAFKMNILWYKLQFNVGKEGGQEIMHVHLHFLAD
jgi:histidine triad (HIT) family protein